MIQLSVFVLAVVLVFMICMADPVPGPVFPAAGSGDERFTARPERPGTALGLALLGTTSSALAACGDDTATTSEPESKGFGKLTYQLSWIKNVEFAGMYVADTNGYYKAARFSSCAAWLWPPSPPPVRP